MSEVFGVKGYKMEESSGGWVLTRPNGENVAYFEWDVTEKHVVAVAGADQVMQAVWRELQMTLQLDDLSRFLLLEQRLISSMSMFRDILHGGGGGPDGIPRGGSGIGAG